MKVPYVLVVVAVIVIVVGFRWLVGRFLTLEGRTLGAVSALEKASKRYDHAAIALSAVLGLHLQPEDPISQTLLPACSRWDATVGAQLSAGDQLQVSMNQARSEFTAAELALQQANDLVLTLTGPDPYGRLGAQDDPAGAAPIVQLATDSGAPYAMGRLLAGQSDFAGAAAAYQGAIDSGDADVAPRAAVNLGMLCEEKGDFASAAAAYQVAIVSGHADAAALARRQLEHLERTITTSETADGEGSRR